MTICILTEGFQHTGYGHISRCMAFADEIKQRGINVLFIVNGDENAPSLVGSYSIAVFDWRVEKERLMHFLSEADQVIIDSYLADVEVYKMVEEIVGCCVYIDDYNRIEYPPGIVMNGTVGAELLDYPVNKEIIYLLGKEYVIVRQAFRLPLSSKHISDTIKTILITFGGTDPKELTLPVLLKVCEWYPDSIKNVVLGAAMSKQKEITKIAETKDGVELFYNVDAETMKELMLQSDVAISAAGQTINELAIAGLPSVIFKVADNQDNNIAGWLSLGFIDRFIDSTKEWRDDELKSALKCLEEKSEREKHSKRGISVLDGRGVERIIKKLLYQYFCSNVHISPAKEKDLMPLFELATDKVVRKNSFSTNEITIEEHTGWFHKVLADTHRKLYVIYAKDDFVGQVRFDEEENDAVISIGIVSLFRGLGLASDILKMTVKQYFRETPKINSVFAYVKADNVASQQAFMNAGFEVCVNEDTNVFKYLYKRK